METYQAEDTVKERFGKKDDRDPRTGAIVIGPAGENLVRFAVIENDHWRSAGRTGVGTVMGSKRLKAVLFQGDRRRTFYDEKGVRALSKELGEMSRGHAGVKAYRTLGTPMMVKIVNQAGAFPTRYWSQGVFDRWRRSTPTRSTPAAKSSRTPARSASCPAGGSRRSSKGATGG